PMAPTLTAMDMDATKPNSPSAMTTQRVHGRVSL
ncbi:MAG: hypothetical protein ACI90Y_001876, partial [Polaromonas sp.]